MQKKYSSNDFMLKTLDLISETLVMEKHVILRMVKQFWAYTLTFHILLILYKVISVFIQVIKTSLLE